MDYASYYFENEYRKLNERAAAIIERTRQQETADRAKKATATESGEMVEKDPVCAAVRAKINKYKGVK